MRRSVRSVSLALALIASSSAAEGVAAEVYRAGDISFALPAGWSRVVANEPASSATQRGLAPSPRPRVAASWVREDGGASFNHAIRAGHLEVHPSRVPLARAELEAALDGAGEEVRWFHVRDFRTTGIAGVMAYRIDSVVGLHEEELRHIQILLSGAGTHLLTFTADASAYPQVGDDLEEILRSVCLEGRAGLLAQMPAWLCCGFLGIAAGTAVAARRRRRTPRRGSKWLAHPEPASVKGSF